MQKILVVEDDQAIIDSLSEYLRGENFEVTSVSGQREAEKELQSSIYDLALLDVSLANGSGFGVYQIAKDNHVPAIFLTASDDENSIVKGLDMGAEDYITKPFRPRELLSRIRSVLRRHEGNSSIIVLGTIEVDTDKAVVSKNKEEITLSALEYRILMMFINNRGILLSRNKLLEGIWDIGGDFVNDNTLTVYIKRLREKIEEDPQNPELIKTVRGMGYRMD